MPIIGVSVAVPDPHGRRLQDYRVALGDDSARLIPTHVTLLPPTEVDTGAIDEIGAHLARVATEVAPFRLHLRGTGSFRPVSPVVFIGVVEGISECEQLTARVRTGPLRGELRFPYHPHVTVAHELPDELLDRAFAELADFQCVFHTDRFHLYLHDETTGWRPQQTFQLGAERPVAQ